MRKEIVKIFVEEKCPTGYGRMPFGVPYEITEEGQLDKLVEWSKGKDVKVYRHFLRKVEENFDKYQGQYHTFGRTKVPYCDWVYYLDIWYQ